MRFHIICLWIVLTPVQSLLSQKMFSLVPPEHSGVLFQNSLKEDRYRNVIVYQYYYNGGGLAIGDLNNDGWSDLVFTGNMVPNRLYLNQQDFRFLDITAQSQFVVPGKASWCTGVSLIDINQDGWLDIYVCRSGKLQVQNRRNLLYVNQGAGQDGIPVFEEQAAKFGLDDPGFSIQMAFFDMDKDNDLDAYLLNHGEGFFQEEDLPRLRTDRHSYHGDKLFENQHGTFVDISESAGIEGTSFGYGLGVGIGDLNQDGWEDIYVSNDFFEHDYLYLNQGNKHFWESIHTATRHISNYAMGNDIADINGDGLLDIMVLDMAAEDNRRQKANMSGMNPEEFEAMLDKGYHHQYMFNTLHLNQGNGTFSDVAQLTGTASTDWSWAPLMADFDNDGQTDIFITNGLRKDARNTDFRNTFDAKLQEIARDPLKKDLSREEWKAFLAQMPSEKLSNYLFHQKGNLHFDNVAADWGLDQAGFSNGAAYGDLDNDGDLDLVVNNVDSEAFIYKNQAELRGNHSIRVKLEGPADNPWGIGAQLRLKAGGHWQVRQLYLSRGYQSSVEPVLHIGLGRTQLIDSLIVTWPDGKTSLLTQLSDIDTLRLSYDKAGPAPPPDVTPSRILEELKSPFPVAHIHQENEFDDFEREVLLPHKMSRFGPSLAIGDVNGDGLEDCFIGGASASPAGLYLQQKTGRFRPSNQDLWQGEADMEDLGSLLFDADRDGDLDLYVVSGGSAVKKDSDVYQDRIYLNDGQGNFSKFEGVLPDITSSGSCVRAADVDQDGDLDVFVGGRHVPGAYGEAPSSYLLINEDGFFEDRTEDLAPELKTVGMVTDATWSDVDSDGDPDLLLVGEWMPLTLFDNRSGSFSRQEPLPYSQGWWFSIAAEDMDGDGDEDYILGNLGLNYKYKASPESPFELFVDDFDANGQKDIVLSYYQKGELFPLRGRSCSAQQIPDLKQQFPSYNAFAEATLSEIYGGSRLDQALHKQAFAFASLYLENQGNGKLVPHELPRMAQLSSINAILLDDFDGDDHKDILVAGNLYVSEVETPRNDAGVGLLLKGNGQGEFQPLSIRESGFFVPGDVKDMKSVRIGKDLWILVANNDGPLQMFRRQ